MPPSLASVPAAGEMSHLAISLLGAGRVALDGQPLASPQTRKTFALLAYLAVESGHPHRREALGALFWPNFPDKRACSNLRQSLYRMRHALAGSAGDSLHLLTSAHEVEFNAASDYWVDAVDFVSLISACRAHHAEVLPLCPDCLGKLEAAVDLYRGEFLAGFSLPGCLQFQWWQVVKQEIYHGQAIEALALLAKHYDRCGDYARLSRWAHREIELEPWCESAHRSLMRALALSGERGQALRQYEACQTILAREFGMQPSPETTRLYVRIREGSLD